MANNKDYEITLKLKAEVEKAIQDLGRTKQSIADVAQSAVKANADIGRSGGSVAPLAATAKAMQSTALSAKELAFVTRGLPAQFTDIFTSLQGGQRPLTVLLQQGGQLKDMFGGIGPALRAVGTYALRLVNPITVGIAAVAGLGFAFKAAADEADAFNTAIALTGNAAETSLGELRGMAQNISGATNATVGKASDVLAQVAATGKFTHDQLQAVATAAINLQDATGRAIKDTIKDFVALGEDPVEGILKLNEAVGDGTNVTHFLTQATIDNIRRLKEQGDEAGATQLALEAYADAINERAPQVVEHLSTWASIWRDIKTAAKDAGDAVVETMRDSDAQVSKFIHSMSATVSGFNVTLGLAGEALGRYFDLRSKQAQRPDFSNVVSGETAVDSKAEREAEKKREEARKDREQAEKDFANIVESHLSREKKLEEDIANIRKVGQAAGKEAGEIEVQVAAARKAFADAEAKRQKKSKKTDEQKVEEAAQRELENLQKQVALTATLEDGEKRVTEAARIHYEITEGAYRSASAATKAALVAAAEERDRQAEATEAAAKHKKEVEETTRAYERLHDELRTPAEASLETAIASLDTLNKALELAIANRDELAQKQIMADVSRAVDKSLGIGRGQQQGVDGLYQQFTVGGEFNRLNDLQANENEDYQRRLEALEAYRQKESDLNIDWNAKAEALEAQHQARLRQIEQSRQTLALNAASDFFGSLSTLQHSENTKIARIGKAAAIAQAIINTYQAATAAYASLASIPYVGPALGAAAAAAAIAAGLANVAQIRAQSTNFDVGGYTGPGARLEPAGVVHKGEYVQPQYRMQEPGALDFMRHFHADGMDAIYAWRGYADGGLVSGASSGGGLPSPRLDSSPQAGGGQGARPGDIYLLFDADEVAQRVTATSHFRRATLDTIAENPRAVQTALNI